MTDNPGVSRYGRPQRGRRIDAVGLKPIKESVAFLDVREARAGEPEPEAPLALGAKIGVVTFPGSLDDGDAARAVRLAGGTPVKLWHREADLGDVAAVVLPGGFSYGDYLRAGAIARFSPVMGSVIAAAEAGMPVLGICNGFQVLCESHLLPGALIRNDHRHFLCRDQWLRVENVETAWTRKLTQGQQILVPVKNGEGGYVADAETLAMLEGEGRVVFRYVQGNPNGSYADIAGVRNSRGNVVGLMPHPEHAVESLTGPSTDGLAVFTSVLAALVAA
jgi:phosphoribosylformylglycinamidine synthase I